MCLSSGSVCSLRDVKKHISHGSRVPAGVLHRAGCLPAAFAKVPVLRRGWKWRGVTRPSSELENLQSVQVVCACNSELKGEWSAPAFAWESHGCVLLPEGVKTDS